MNSISDVINNKLCTGCGVCVSESPNIKGMKWDEEGFLIPNLIEDLEESPNALKVCPFNINKSNTEPDEDRLAEIFLADAPVENALVGRYFKSYAGYSQQYRESSSSGGIATYIFEQLLIQKIVDYIFVVKGAEGGYCYQLFSNIEDIRSTSKTRYIPVSMDKLFETIDKIDGKIAISGVACFVKAVRLKQTIHEELKTKIAFVVGIICGGLKSKFFSDYLAQKSGIEGSYYNQDYRIKDEKSMAHDYAFGAMDQNRILHTVKMRSLGDMWGTGLFKSNACDFCDDVTTELADISLGDAWLEPYLREGLGNSVILTRSLVAENIIVKAIEDNSDLNVSELSIDRFIASQKGSFNHRRVGLAYRIKLRTRLGYLVPKKRERVLQNIPFEFKLVQRIRMKLREASLQSWIRDGNSDSFEKNIEKYKRILKYVTRVYHRIQIIRKKIGLKNI